MEFKGSLKLTLVHWFFDGQMEMDFGQVPPKALIYSSVTS